MLTVAPPNAVEARCNATFEALMWSMARPGEVRDMPEAGLAPIIETLVDLECSVFADAPVLQDLAARTGALMTNDMSRADHIFLASLDQPAARLASIACGDALYPDDGATLAAEVKHGQGHRVRLTGPGVEGSRELTLDVSPEFWARRARLCIYPQGFDLLLVDRLSVVGIPRSTTVEVI